ncbi:hypothetical protein BGP_2324 [Beggiatoa sp. PS]|nr:hypothetical protein BGP_2324 [Beggiatoa sp. PS]
MPLIFVNYVCELSSFQKDALKSAIYLTTVIQVGFGYFWRHSYQNQPASFCSDRVQNLFCALKKSKITWTPTLSKINFGLFNLSNQ